MVKVQNWPVKAGRGWIHCVYGSDHPLKGGGQSTSGEDHKSEARFEDQGRSGSCRPVTTCSQPKEFSTCQKKAHEEPL